MSAPLHPGPHPDADWLNAFVEGMLPEHERQRCLAHLAECSDCREIVFLAQAPQPAPAAVAIEPKVAAWRRRWFSPVPVLAAVAALGVVVLAVSIYLQRKGAAPDREIIARNRYEPRPPVEPRGEMGNAMQPVAPARARPQSKHSARATQPLPPPVPAIPSPPPLPATAVLEAPLAAPAPGSSQSRPAFAPSVVPPPPPPPPHKVTMEAAAAADGLSGIAGTVSDPTGAAIPGALVTLRQLFAGGSERHLRIDENGEFRVADLPAGKYELRIESTGFIPVTMQIDLQPRNIARVNSQLSVGSTAETVEVSAAAPAVAASTAQTAELPATPRALPSHLPAATSTTSGKLMLTVDSAGNLFFSGNRGKRWKAVKPVWRGKVASVATATEEPAATARFQLTTDSDAVWLSRDGKHWYPESPSQR